NLPEQPRDQVTPVTVSDARAFAHVQLDAGGEVPAPPQGLAYAFVPVCAWRGDIGLVSGQAALQRSGAQPFGDLLRACPASCGRAIAPAVLVAEQSDQLPMSERRHQLTDLREWRMALGEAADQP